MSGAELIELLLTTAARIAAGWIRSEADDRLELETRAWAAIAALRGEREATATAHETRTRASDEAIEAARERPASMGGGTERP